MHARKTCGAAHGGFGRCGRKVDPLARMGLCDIHILNAYDYLCGKIGMTDVMPWPCQACGSRLGVSYPSGWLCAVCEWRLGQPVDEEFVPPRVDVVYYLRFRDRVKIGTSSNPRTRLPQIRYEKLLAFERGDRATEQKRHEQFAEWRFVGSEWFHQNDALEAHIAALAAGVEDPWNLYARWRSEAIALRA